MAPMLFAKSISLGEKIKVFNNGENIRDFTFVEDVVDAIIKCCNKPAYIDNKFDSFNPNSSTSFAPHRIFNVGNSSPIKVLDFINILEKSFQKKAKLEFYPRQPGDVLKTAADISLIEDWIEYKPLTPLDKGIDLFIKWFVNYNAIKYL